MLSQEMRMAVLTLRKQGHGSRKIAKDLGLGRNAVREVIASGRAEVVRRQGPLHRLEPFVESLRQLHVECRGNMVRVWEELLARHGANVPYTTLTRFCRGRGIGVLEKQPAGRIVTGPGEEMQHDTSPYTIVIGGKSVKRQCASLVLGYSRRMHIRFYEKFDRFHCKVFLTEAFQALGGTCGRCMIDNSHVVIVCGTGKNAQVSPEMEAFEKRFSFEFEAHELGDADRSGKVERPFWYIERNFLTGRTFKDDADLNLQAQAWLDEKADVRRMRELGASPRELFVAERPHLIPLPLYVPEVYQIHRRDVDAYGYVHLHAMRYSAPAKALGKTVTVRESDKEVVLLQGSEELARHKKLSGADGHNQSTLSGHERRGKAPRSIMPEETRLKGLGREMSDYLVRLKAERGGRYVWSLRKLYGLLCQHRTEDFLRAVARASEHGLFDVRRIESVLLGELARQEYLLPMEPQDYEDTDGFRKGGGTLPSDLSQYGLEEGDEHAR
jgi:transposase